MSEGGGARYLRPNRDRLEWRMVDLDGSLPQDHRVRVVWGFVEGMDLSDFYARIRLSRAWGGSSGCGPCGFVGVVAFRDP